MNADKILARMRADNESDWPTRLLAAIGRISAHDPSVLSTEQVRHLQAASHGLQVEEIGVVLGTADGTVATHLLRARRKLRAKNTTHAVAIALRQGLIQ